MATINVAGKDYPTRLSLYAVGEIQKRYGKMESLAVKAVDPIEVPWIITLLINEGLKYEALETGGAAKPLTVENTQTLLNWGDLQNPAFTQAIVDTVNEGTGGEKNVTAGDLMEAYEQTKKGLFGKKPRKAKTPR